MRRLAFVFLSAIFLTWAPSALAQAEGAPSRPEGLFRGSLSPFTFGGSVGVGFGDVNWVSLSPQAGYLVAPRLYTGLTGTFQYTNDQRYNPHFNATNFGFGVFTRYVVFSDVFAHVEWSWLSYQALTGFGSTERNSVSSLYVGAGYGLPVGGASSVVLEVLRDVTGNAKRVYGTPWLIRAGFAAGF